MKNLILLAALCSLLLMACKKSDKKPQNAAASITFAFNGTAETATLVTAVYYKSQNTVQIAGSLGNQSQGLELVIENPATGSYDLSTTSTIIASFSTALDQQHTYLGTTGNVVITTFTSDAMAGTFAFSGKDGLGESGSVTNGAFSVKLTTQ